jgi:hypothetical protein
MAKESTPRGFRVELDNKIKVCFLKVWGPWTESDGKNYVKHFAEILQPFQGHEFDVVADISEFPPQKDEVNLQIQETMRHAATSGMKRAANVVNSAMTKIQIERLSEETKLPLFSFFTGVEPALKWLRPEGWDKAYSRLGSQWK